MHELTMIEGMLKIIEEKQRQHGFTKVTAVAIVCGHYNCLSEDTLRFCFEAAEKPDWLKDAKLRIRRLPADPDKPVDNTVYIEHLEVEE